MTAASLQTASDYTCWCGCRRRRLIFRTPRFGLVACASCGCYRIDPPPLQDDARAAAFYTDYYARLDQGTNPEGEPPERRENTYLSRFWRVAEQVSELRRPGQLALDIGCGDGNLCAELRNAGWREVVGLDVSRTRIARARRLHPEIRFSDRAVVEVGLGPASAELVVMDNVIEHLPSPARVLSELHGYVATGGRLVIITPNMRSGNFRLLGRWWTPELAPHAHVFLFTPAALRQLLAQTGYIVEHAGAFATPLSSWHDWGPGLRGAAIKETVWRLGQNLGNLYGRLLGAGAMLYAVARPSRAVPAGTR